MNSNVNGGKGGGKVPSSIFLNKKNHASRGLPDTENVTFDPLVTYKLPGGQQGLTHS